ncbi:ribonuclease H-like domain-containing protein [Tanacetum coccineum]|uniref:Ribonuclease H-like domain-containing protein n=1 Tax=Tanacetum coccineum TaxID=301880 RepID=A0ABQ5FGQ7_9ASTR
MCDKKNSVLFTDTGCFVLSPDFKLADESQVLLKVPRKNNMYSVDMKNIVPKECLTCLVAKATLDESMLWHRRQGHAMLADSKFTHSIGAEAVYILIAYVQNRVLVVKPHNKTPYELFRGRTPALSFMRPFGCHVTILNTLDYLGKFDGKSDEGFFVGYSMNSDGPKWLFDIDVLTKSMNYVPVISGTNSNDLVDVSLFDSSSKNVSNDVPQPSSDARKKDDEGVNKRSRIADQEKSKNSTQGVNTAGPKVDMSNITTTYLVPSTLNTRIHKDHSLDHVIGDVQSGVLTRRMTKTTNEQGFIRRAQKVIPSIKRSKLDRSYARRASAVQVTTETRQDWLHMDTLKEDGIDYDEVFAPVARIEAIRLFLAYASFKDFIVYQMDVKSAFLIKLYMVYIKLLELGMRLYLPIYWTMDFRETASTPMETSKPLLKDAEAEDVDVHLYRSMIGSLMYLTSSRPDIIYLKGQPKLGLWYPKDSPFDLEAYSDSDYVGASLDRKSTTGGCQFLGSRLISWQCKKQTIVAKLYTEDDFFWVGSCSCCGQVLWIQNQMLDYGYNFMNTKIFIDNESTPYSLATNDEIQVSAVGLTFYCSRALLVSPTATGIGKCREVQIQALVDGKKNWKEWRPITDEACQIVMCMYLLHSNDPLLSGVGIDELSEFDGTSCTNLVSKEFLSWQEHKRLSRLQGY